MRTGPFLIAGWAAALLAGTAAVGGAQSRPAQDTASAPEARHGTTVAVGLGMLGLGGELQRALGSRLAVRVGGYQTGLLVTVEDVGVATVDARMRGASLLADLFFRKNGHRALTAGVVYNRSTLELAVQPGPGQYTTLNGHDYRPSQIGTLSWMVTPARVSPYVGLRNGSSPRGKRRLGFRSDLGLIVTRFALDLTSPHSADNPGLAADLEAEQGIQRDKLRKFPGIPSFSTMLTFRF